MATVTNLGNVIYGQSLNWAVQFTDPTTGDEFFAVMFYRPSVTQAVLFPIWNITDDAVSLVTFSSGGGRCYPQEYTLDRLTNGKLATVNQDYFIILDLASRTCSFSHLVSSYANEAKRHTSNLCCQGHTGHVIIGGGADPANMFIDWYNMTTEAYDGVLAFASSPGGNLRPNLCSKYCASDGYNYAYGSLYYYNWIAAINMTTKAETGITIPGASHNILHPGTLSGNPVIRIEAIGVGDYWLDGTSYSPADPGDIAAMVEWHPQTDSGTATAGWFTSVTTTLDKTELMAYPSTDVSISYNKGGGPTTLTTGPVPQDAMQVQKISAANPNKISLIVGGGAYGPCYKLDGTDSSVSFLGYPSPTGNVYGDRWNNQYQKWVRIGYSRECSVYDPALEWTSTLITSDYTTVNPQKQVQPGEVSITESHWMNPVTGTTDYAYYWATRLSNQICWYDPTVETNDGFGALTITNAQILSMATINSGQYIVISSADTDNVGRLHIFEVSSQTITKTLVPNAAVTDVGVICEVTSSPGQIICISGLKSSGNKAWRIDTSQTGEAAVIWEVSLGSNIFSDDNTGMITTAIGSYYIEVTLDNKIYFYGNGDLCWLSPTDGSTEVAVVAASLIPDFKIRWNGSSLFMFREDYAGDLNLYRIDGLVQAYTRGVYPSLPTDDTNLTNTYTETDITNVATDNEVYASQTGITGYILHEYKNDAGSYDLVKLSWDGKSTTAPSSSIVKLQIYNRTTLTWDDVATNNTADAGEDFTLSDTVNISANYKDANNIISCRVWQEIV